MDLYPRVYGIIPCVDACHGGNGNRARSAQSPQKDEKKPNRNDESRNRTRSVQ